MTWDQDLEQGRRVAFWQRVYLQCLAELVASPPAIARCMPDDHARLAGEYAKHAVRQLDEWLETTQPAKAPSASRDTDPAEDDDSDDSFLGR